jgi:hypothetical protein
MKHPYLSGQARCDALYLPSCLTQISAGEISTKSASASAVVKPIADRFTLVIQRSLTSGV